jgi:putative nucleotidyltransferase with HDIG domain
MRFALRAFAFCFIPFALVLGISFWSLRSEVRKRTREELQKSVREKQLAVDRIHAGNQLQVIRVLRVAGNNAALQDGLRQLNADPMNLDAKAQVEVQLRLLSHQTGFSLLSVQNASGTQVAWVVHDATFGASSDAAPPPLLEGLTEYRGRLYQLISAPVGEAADARGYISVGDGFDLSDYGVPVVLMKDGRIVVSSVPGVSAQELTACGDSPECDLRVGNGEYVSSRLREAGLGPGYILRSLQNADAAAAPLEHLLNAVFLAAALGAGLIAFVVSRGASHSMLRPLAGLASHFRKSEASGLLAELPPNRGRIVEIRELIDSFNRAASSIRETRNGLQAVYVEFAGSLAHALDARDGYTANHSQRVSQIAMAIAQAVHLPAEEQEALRIGALLHDIGKIGIPDYILQKSGVLSDSEFDLIRQHPIIGCRILEGVRGFSPYLPVVELHHENWDGSGYPYGLSGKAVPLAARIVHVADAWDAMTSDRPYRRGFTHRRALAIIQQNAGTQFDPEIAEIFLRLMQCDTAGEMDMFRLAAAVGPSAITEEVYKEDA